MSQTNDGGKPEVKPVIKYAPPQGPTNQSRQGPGLGGENCGPSGTQGRH